MTLRQAFPQSEEDRRLAWVETLEPGHRAWVNHSGSWQEVKINGRLGPEKGPWGREVWLSVVIRTGPQLGPMWIHSRCFHKIKGKDYESD